MFVARALPILFLLSASLAAAPALTDEQQKRVVSLAAKKFVQLLETAS
jgi:hypothetical protein